MGKEILADKNQPLGSSAPDALKQDLLDRLAPYGPLRRRRGDSESHARRPPTGPPRAVTGASRRRTATALPRLGRDRRGLQRSPREPRAVSLGTVRRPTVGSRPHQHSPAAAKPEPEPQEAGRGQRGAGSSREEPQGPQSKPEGRGAGRWPLPRRPLEGRHEGGASTQPAGAAPANGRHRGAGRGAGSQPAPAPAPRPLRGSGTSDERLPGGWRSARPRTRLRPLVRGYLSERRASGRLRRSETATASFSRREHASVRRTRPGEAP
ncbi:basic salivary proline-rich protein 2-like [Cricetulus griseus]|uniref:Basic salivary proline-rich protein 2-like n=1 Tax=Cricetulus griseus TaxID=10029 RepID=A0A9J7H0I8_CRIGR|nr:basic salivary proline-rich protein 2-like [Cricetulus griseus]